MALVPTFCIRFRNLQVAEPSTTLLESMVLLLRWSLPNIDLKRPPHARFGIGCQVRL